ncbi:3-hydroxyisobutyryl-CoA hydrolase [Corynebacterium alimapuense]|uniref:3-hydroxyisobutyryl-CoA hydrolase n=1 Tax=Corynebacterium alimapuense TaxID=1576874 RepID=A0A3M8K6R1_9CORY|nr:3-hydroxyisobutyryl-CoA hydrolase [Corynebacterium alimapuense]RNE48569.1 3-hydroxyisobutyryl-CoA hydrolase [Corynebacterium alimapuense]
MITPTTDAPVLVSIRQTTGVLELNRPKALNSLNHDMITIIAEALESWVADDRITQVLIVSHSPKAFCSGGDVRFAREGIINGQQADIDAFFAEEYDLNHVISNFPKPYIALIDGIVMGGGSGISLHGSHRIITDKAWLSMPEMAIGYITDVGMSYLLQRLPGANPAIGAFIGLTGYRLTPADLIHTGAATHMVSDAAGFAESVIAEGIEAAIVEYALDSQSQSRLAELAKDINATFDGSSWERIDAALATHPNHEFRELVQELMSASSPSAVIATAELFAANRQAKDLRAGLDNERRLGELVRRHPDFVEGVRAVLVDKTRDPHFRPAQDAEFFRQVLS